MKKYQIQEHTINEIIRWAHDYGRSQQFNFSLFGPDCSQAQHFTTEKAMEYIHEHIVKNLSEL